MRRQNRATCAYIKAQDTLLAAPGLPDALTVAGEVDPRRHSSKLVNQIGRMQCARSCEAMRLSRCASETPQQLYVLSPAQEHGALHTRHGTLHNK